MEKQDFISRLSYLCQTLETILGVNGKNPLWYISKYGDISPFTFPIMPLDKLSEMLFIPSEDGDPFTISLAFSSKDSIFSFIDNIGDRLNHPYKILAEFDEAFFFEFSDIVADILYDWYYETKNEKANYLFDIFNQSFKQKLFRTSAQKLAKVYKDVQLESNPAEFRQFVKEKVGKRLREYWFGYSLNFNRGLYETNKFRLTFTTERGVDVMTDTLLYINYDVFENATSFEKSIQNLFRGIFPHVNFPKIEPEKRKGFNIFEES